MHRAIGVCEALNTAHADGIAEGRRWALYDVTERLWNAHVVDVVTDEAWRAGLTGGASSRDAGLVLAEVAKRALAVCGACWWEDACPAAAGFWWRAIRVSEAGRVWDTGPIGALCVRAAIGVCATFLPKECEGVVKRCSCTVLALHADVRCSWGMGRDDAANEVVGDNDDVDCGDVPEANIRVWGEACSL